mgnify:CR=1 FL=1
MPSGRVHDRITLWCLPLIVGVTAAVTRSPAITIIVSSAFLVGSLMLGPDLDIHSVQYTRWGPIRWIWLPYQIAIKHRSRLSHGPIIGTALRVIYLSLWLALFAAIGVEVFNWLWDAQLTWQALRTPFRGLLKKYFVEWLAVIIGLELGSISHSASDMFGSRLARRRNRKKRRRS